MIHTTRKHVRNGPDPALAEDFRHSLHGQLLTPDAEPYETARRVWNGQIDRRPRMIARCADVSDVVAAVRFAQQQQLAVAVRGGGHSSAGFGTIEGGLLIDVSAMKRITVDPDRRLAWAEPGLTLGELIQATQPYGLATTTGIVSTTGIAGLTLGGGNGWLAGKFGLTCDNVLAFQMVTAAGTVLRASEHENSDLYWALRGGGGNFEIVTEFEYRLHPLGQVLAGIRAYPLTRAPAVLRFYRDFTQACPDELTVYAAMLTAPTGQPVVALVLCYCGALAEGERALAPLQQLGLPAADLVRPMSYLDAITLLDADSPAGRQYYEKGCTLPEISEPVIEALVARAEARTSPLSLLTIQHCHGAAARVPEDATAYPVRRTCYMPHIVAAWEQGDRQTHAAWVREAIASLRPYTLETAYVNFLGEADTARVRAAYGRNYARLAALKHQYDPSNFFRLNQNILPASAALPAGRAN